MIEQIKKYKNGLLGVGIYIVFVLCIFFFINPHILTWQAFVGLIIPFFLFQYIFPSPKYSQPALNTSNISTWRLLRGLLIALVVVVGLFSFGFFEKENGESFSGISILSFFIGSTIFFVSLFNSIFKYFKTKDKRFLLVSIIFIVVILLEVIYGVY